MRGDYRSSHARSRAYDESIGDICVYVDDVVLVSSSWLVGLIDVFNSSDADFVGGPVKLWWREVDRPEWFTEDCDALLAAKDHGDSVVIELIDASAVITINTAYQQGRYLEK